MNVRCFGEEMLKDNGERIVEMTNDNMTGNSSSMPSSGNTGSIHTYGHSLHQTQRKNFYRIRHYQISEEYGYRMYDCFFFFFTVRQWYLQSTQTDTTTAPSSSNVSLNSQI